MNTSRLVSYISTKRLRQMLSMSNSYRSDLCEFIMKINEDQTTVRDMLWELSILDTMSKFTMLRA